MYRTALALLLLMTPVHAEEPVAPPPEEEGWSLMERGVKLLFEGLVTEMEPALEGMGDALAEIEPALRDLQPMLRDLVEMAGDLRNYHAPERLPNGDILIRRKSEPEMRLDDPAAPEIEL